MPRLVSERLRAGLAAGCLVVVGLGLVSPARWSEVQRDLHRLRRALAGEPVAPAESRGFWFDADFAAFLEDVQRLTPPDSTVAVLVPTQPDLYRYQAIYQLAPRRTVDEARIREATFVATYRSRPCGAGRGVAVRGGELCSK